jgi:predicted MFS family arabinose efflux permease
LAVAATELAGSRGLARRAVATALLCQGAATADWVTRLPSIKANLDLGAGGLGLALVGTPVGLAVAVLIAPAAVRRFSSAGTARWATTCAGLTIALPALAWNGVSLTLGLIVLGLAFGVAEVSVNVQAVAVERAYARPVMTGMHAMWSIGMIVGSLAGSVAAAAGVAPAAQLGVAGVLLAGVAAFVGRWFLEPTLQEGSQEAAEEREPRRRLQDQPAVVVTGLIAFCAFLAEGSVTDWGSVFMHDVEHASLAVAGLAVSVFSVGQVVARLAGDRIVTRFGRTATMWRTALIAAAGMLVAISAASSVVALLGYGVLGLGGALIIPTAFSVAGIAAAFAPAWALSRVTGMGYAGLFLGPAAIGLVTHAIGLTAALLIPATLLLLIVPLTLRLRHELGSGA